MKTPYAVGGIDGQAGLFGTVAAVGALLSRIVAVYRERHAGLFDPPPGFGSFYSPAPRASRALGFDTPSLHGSSSGKWFSRMTVGHLGFTGTSFWMDLARVVTVVLLSNRVHPTRDNRRIRVFRPLLHDRVMDGLNFSE